MNIDNYSIMKKLFEPRSIAIIGASTNPSKIGHKIISNIAKVGFKGKVYPINPKADKILNYKAYASLADVCDNIDMASIVLPAAIVFDALKTCAENKIKIVTISRSPKA